MQFLCPSTFRSLRTIYTHSVLWKRQKKINLAIINNYNFCDKYTDRQTDMATLWPTRPREPSRWKLASYAPMRIYIFEKTWVMFLKFTQWIRIILSTPEDNFDFHSKEKHAIRLNQLAPLSVLIICILKWWLSVIVLPLQIADLFWMKHCVWICINKYLWGFKYIYIYIATTIVSCRSYLQNLQTNNSN